VPEQKPLPLINGLQAAYLRAGERLLDEVERVIQLHVPKRLVLGSARTRWRTRHEPRHLLGKLLCRVGDRDCDRLSAPGVSQGQDQGSESGAMVSTCPECARLRALISQALKVIRRAGMKDKMTAEELQADMTQRLQAVEQCVQNATRSWTHREHRREALAGETHAESAAAAPPLR
jgi:hypothetical protein